LASALANASEIPVSVRCCWRYTESSQRPTICVTRRAR